MKSIQKRYVIKLPNGAVLKRQRSYSNQDIGVVLYKTLNGANKAAEKIKGGVFTIYILASDDLCSSNSDYYDAQIEKECKMLGISIS